MSLIEPSACCAHITLTRDLRLYDPGFFDGSRFSDGFSKFMFFHGLFIVQGCFQGSNKLFSLLWFNKMV